ncbi:hypothetical protein N7528_009214 [Penicillium herquei]|nr:hypothetical protein N7528_009214 [Penicillium herquei]
MEPIHPSVIKQPICLTSTTAPDWSEKEAFRELYQNWKDAIMQDHDLPPLGFPVVVTETDKEILITVTKPSLGDPTTTSYAGFICFKKTTGTIELTNFDSILDTKCLEIGYSSKVGDLRLIGHHGEGLKLAVLALSRRKYHIKLLANSCYWNFTFRGREERNLYYTVNPASREKTHRLQVKFARREEQSFPREFIANIWRDVSVVITRDSTVSRLNAVDFWTWMQITIDINPPPGLIRTLAGDLIVDEAYKGKIYVKGIRYEVCDGHDEGLMIGYNLGTGFINRERRIAICGVSQRVIAEIWARAIETGASSIVALYSQILMENPDATDVRDIEHMVNNETAKKVWSHLHEDAKARGLFYYPQNTKGLAAENIRTYLRLQPAPMPVALWRLLRKFQLISSTDEELLSRLKNTKMIQVPNTLFSRQVDRSLRGTLAAEEQTKALKVVYVEGWKGGLALGLIQGVLYVHQQWLDPGRMNDTCCPPAPVHDDAHFEHVIEDIISDALSLLHRHELLGSEDVSLFRRRALQRLHDMPRSVRATTVSGSVVVDWDVGHSLAFMEANGSLITYSVTLHGIQCLAERDSLLLSSSSCGCPTKDVLLKERNVVFDHHNSYITFPVVSRNQEKAILGIPPAPVPIYGKFGFIDRVEIPVNVPYGPVVELADSSNPLVSCDPAPEEFLTCDQQNQSDDESYVSKPLEQIDQVAGLNQFLDPWNASESTQGILTSPLVRDYPKPPSVPPKRTIKAQEYLSVTLNSSSGRQRYLLFVHEIIFQPGEDDLVDALKATKFSFLSDCCTTPPTTAVPGEVVLHFHDFAILGECSDADTVRFEELVSWDSSEDVKYTSKPDGMIPFIQAW